MSFTGGARSSKEMPTYTGQVPRCELLEFNYRLTGLALIFRIAFFFLRGEINSEVETRLITRTKQ